MVRSMYSGVAGMKANQSRMDVIGNNIANANTYGFKASRVTFRDMYYQQLRSASAGTTTRGGINPSMVGYGAQFSSSDLLMTSSSMTSTGVALDACITGEGFFQVMDADGNIYYTKAGMFDIDPTTGAVIDSNGNFVLGTSATGGKLDSIEPGRSKIFITVDPVQASTASVSSQISGRTITIESTNQNTAANIGFTFSKATDMADGDYVRAIVDSTAAVVNIQINEKATFTSMDELEGYINDAITEAYGGTHPGGDYQFTMDPDPFETGSLTGAQIVETAAADYEGGGVTVGQNADGSTITNDKVTGDTFLGGFSVVETGLRFSGSGATTVTVADAATGGTDPAPAEPHFLVTLETAASADGGPEVTYTGYVLKSRSDEGSYKVMLKNTAAGADPNDTITLQYPKTGDIEDGVDIPIGTATPSVPTRNLGLGKGTFSLTGGTEFKLQDVSNLTSISIGADGTITGTSNAGLQTLGRIDLASFANSKGLMQSGNTYFTETSNSGAPQLTIAGEDGTGAIKSSCLEMSNVDLSQEFSDMIVTQRGFQACSRLITVSDTMLEELINLKR